MLKNKMKKLEDIDQNFKKKNTDIEGMTAYDISKPPFKIYGLKYGENGYYRMDTEVTQKANDGVQCLNYHTAGGRIRFATNSKRIILTVTMLQVNLMTHMPLSGSSSFCIYCNGEFSGLFRGGSYEDFKGTWTSELILPEGEKDIVIFFPLYDNVRSVTVSLEEDAEVYEGKEYKNPLPIVFYGSSITQGGCASHPGNAYSAMLSRELDSDFINLGFSGSCKGELPMADYMGKLPMKLFVYDYDHNAPTSEFLRETHESFFLRFRSHNPTVPVIMLSVADGVFGKSEIEKRKEIIKRTYENAKASGDNNVYFIDGQDIYGEIGLRNATVDGCHPNDIGFYAFYKAIRELIERNNLI